MAIPEDKISMSQNFLFVFERIKSSVGKGENTANQHFLLFPQRFLPYQTER